MVVDFQSWYNDFLLIAKSKFYYPEKRVDEIKELLIEYFTEGFTPWQAADQELGWD